VHKHIRRLARVHRSSTKRNAKHILIPAKCVCYAATFLHTFTRRPWDPAGPTVPCATQVAHNLNCNDLSMLQPSKIQKCHKNRGSLEEYLGKLCGHTISHDFSFASAIQHPLENFKASSPKNTATFRRFKMKCIHPAQILPEDRYQNISNMITYYISHARS